jgi:hypothetical protein
MRESNVFDDDDDDDEEEEDSRHKFSELVFNTIWYKFSHNILK